ncbi:MAG: phosphodiester glycosidase family protein [Holosporales bacterium]|jgi:exopolysaccharide biosynthesis protein|nr:phosphodiester glycosidase family protein [Holosporales bacterium]
MPLKRFFVFLVCAIAANSGWADPTYEKREIDRHVIHIVTIPPREALPYLVKAQEGMFGRASVSSCARQFENPIAAINAGFFEIDLDADGVPSATFIVDGKIFGADIRSHSCLVIREGGDLEIVPCQLEAFLTLGSTRIPITLVNRTIRQSDKIILYTDRWGTQTRTPHEDRIEFSFDADCHCTSLAEHGNNPIPIGGYVVSLPKEKVPPEVLQGERSSIMFHFTFGPHFVPHAKDSWIAGIPQVVRGGKVTDDIQDPRMPEHFRNTCHARTLIGLRKDGTIVAIVAEHRASLDFNKMSLGEVRTYLRNNKEILSTEHQDQIGGLTIDQILTALRKIDEKKAKIEGLTLQEAAEIMIGLECVDALNLDGGKSSTMFYKGKTITDGEERAVSDSLVFAKAAP